jgi:hypothetical protein
VITFGRVVGPGEDGDWTKEARQMEPRKGGAKPTAGKSPQLSVPTAHESRSEKSVDWCIGKE